MNLLPQFFHGMVVIGSLSMVGDVSVVSDVFYRLFLNAEYHHSDSRHIVSRGHFGHGATSVKNSLRNHFGRINNV